MKTFGLQKQSYNFSTTVSHNCGYAPDRHLKILMLASEHPASPGEIKLKGWVFLIDLHLLEKIRTMKNCITRSTPGKPLVR